MLTMIEIFEEFERQRESKNWCYKNCINRKMILKAKKIRKQLRQYINCKKSQNDNEKDENAVRKSLSTGFFVNIAILKSDKSYKTLINNQTVKIHPSSVFHGRKPECVLFSELIKTKICYIKNLTLFDRKWLTEVAPFYFES
ncbi:putative ATP-dependent RNA helicase dhx33 [Bonamia ostreae]|uniref:RNA helicase n=1 Tax=Bonamia ostreae TaxID=126728 RepID=A0ABV2AHY5_9EUKA